MLRFKQKKILAVFILLGLSLNSFAKSGLKEKTSTNLVELFKVKSHATDHIKELEAKLLTTNEADQEELLVELAQSLLYYQDRHNKVADSKAAISKGVSSLSVNGSSGKASKLVSGKGPYSTPKIYRKALDAYKKASKLSLNKSGIKYTRKLSELAVKLQKKDELVQVFDELLQHTGDESGTYLAHVDYADGLAKFGDDRAEAQFLSAVNMRSAVDGVEANYRYAEYLLDNGKLRDSFSILDKFSFEERRRYPHIAILRQKIIHSLNINTKEVDDEIEGIRKNISKNPFMGTIPKLTESVKYTPLNKLGLQLAYAHNYEPDDSRGKHSNSWVFTPYGYRFTTSLINAAEVVYNETRGKTFLERVSVAWAIRNRATIDMNDCDFYPGSEGDPDVTECRDGTSSGPQNDFSDAFKRYSCVVHGGTIKFGEPSSEMNDTHVSIGDLEVSGIIWEMFYVINGWIPDHSSSYLFFPSQYPTKNLTIGNPLGVQEWSDNNGCPNNYFCKNDLSYLGKSTPVVSCSENYTRSNGNGLRFWGRKLDQVGVQSRITSP